MYQYREFNFWEYLLYLIPDFQPCRRRSNTDGHGIDLSRMFAEPAIVAEYFIATIAIGERVQVTDYIPHEMPLRGAAIDLAYQRFHFARHSARANDNDSLHDLCSIQSRVAPVNLCLVALPSFDFTSFLVKCISVHPIIFQSN